MRVTCGLVGEQLVLKMIFDFREYVYNGVPISGLLDRTSIKWWGVKWCNTIA